MTFSITIKMLHSVSWYTIVMLSVVYGGAFNKPFRQSVIMLNVVMLSVIMLNVVKLSVIC
jgi:hypothetical protein